MNLTDVKDFDWRCWFWNVKEFWHGCDSRDSWREIVYEGKNFSKSSQNILPITVACSIHMKRGWTHCVYFKPPPAFLTNRTFTHMWTLCILEHIFGKISVVLFILQGFKEKLCFSCDEKYIFNRIWIFPQTSENICMFSFFIFHEFFLFSNLTFWRKSNVSFS